MSSFKSSNDWRDEDEDEDEKDGFLLVKRDPVVIDGVFVVFWVTTCNGGVTVDTEEEGEEEEEEEEVVVVIWK